MLRPGYIQINNEDQVRVRRRFSVGLYRKLCCTYGGIATGIEFAKQLSPQPSTERWKKEEQALNE